MDNFEGKYTFIAQNSFLLKQLRCKTTKNNGLKLRSHRNTNKDYYHKSADSYCHRESTHNFHVFESIHCKYHLIKCL